MIHPSEAYKARKAQAMFALGVTKEQVERGPQVSRILGKVGSRERVMELIRSSEDPEAKKLVEKWDGLLLPKGAVGMVPIEAICLSAGVQVKRILGVVMAEAFEQSQVEGALIAATAHPKIVEKAVETALLPMGSGDRKMLLQHAQFLPMPKNQVVHVHGNVDAHQEDNRSVNLPSLEVGAKALTDRFNDTHVQVPQIPAPQSDILEGDPEDEDDDVR